MFKETNFAFEGQQPIILVWKTKFPPSQFHGQKIFKKFIGKLNSKKTCLVDSQNLFVFDSPGPDQY